MGLLTAEEVAQASVFGIDYLSLSASLMRLPADWYSWRPYGSVRDWRRRTVELGRGGSFEVAAGMTRGGAHATASFNPARIIDPLGWAACPVDRLSEAVEVVWQELRLHVEVLGLAGNARVSRVDVARDFEVAFPSHYVQALQHADRTYETTGHFYWDRSTGYAQTLMAGSKSGGLLRAYDKHVENREAPRGTLRIEFECRGWAKTYGDVDRYADLTDLAVARLGFDRWQWSGAEMEIVDVPTLVRRAAKVAPRERAELVGAFVLAAFDEPEAQSPRLREAAERLEIVLGPTGSSLHTYLGCNDAIGPPHRHRGRYWQPKDPSLGPVRPKDHRGPTSRAGPGFDSPAPSHRL